MIEGMDTVLGENWVPNAEQWKKIRERIRQLEDTPTRQPVAIPQQAPVIAPPAGVDMAAITPTEDPSEEALLRMFPQVPGSIPSNVPVSAGGAVPAGPSAFPPPSQSSLGPPPAQRPSTTAAPRQANLTPETLAKLDPASRAQLLKQNAVKTPDIDTSAGKGYNSSYV